MVGVVAQVNDSQVAVKEIASPDDLVILSVFLDFVRMPAADGKLGIEGLVQTQVDHPLPVMIDEIIGGRDTWGNHFAGIGLGDQGMGDGHGPFILIQFLLEEGLQPERAHLLG